LRTRPEIDGRRIVAWGASYGGFVVLAMLAHHPDLFAAGVDFYGPSDLATFLAHTAEYRRGQRIAEYGDPVRDAKFLADISPADHADRITAPLMIAQGGNDPIVPPAESQRIVDKLRALGRTVRYVVLPDEGHGFAKETNQIRVFEEMVGFLDSLWR
jgi:dipeptidyl aminopeptidase/acylaminoacyl peptidase